MAVKQLTLQWQDYQMFPYERDLALRETRALLKPAGDIDVNGSVQLRTQQPERAVHLTYFKSVSVEGESIETVQERLERNGQQATDVARRKQSTRYSVHGVHEYKGKFNPQVAKAVINYLGLERGRVLDPFCGSGTTLVECAHAGASAVGVDLNPLAVFIANAKLSALTLPASDFRDAGRRVVRAIRSGKVPPSASSNERADYLRNWFPRENLLLIEQLRTLIVGEAPEVQPILQVVASDLLRDYSLQEPQDLRIRRRKSDLPTTPLMDEFERICEKLSANIGAAQRVLGSFAVSCQAVLTNSASATPKLLGMRRLFDGAITSPPYATALPYIDTQRLSLVWLDLVSPAELPRLQAQLIGSREFHGKTDRTWDGRLARNEDKLPKKLHRFCATLRSSLTPEDGFRRRAVPHLLYRYMVGMRDMFASVAKLLKARAPFALIVGHNHTILGGTRYDIDTPDILGQLAASVGYDVEERVEFQTYQRYGLHQKNSVAKEELLVLRKQ